jgi:acyl-CoA synthetase (AMP-forming)/AMP-acid ligase II
MTQKVLAPATDGLVTSTLSSIFRRCYSVFAERPAIIAIDGSTTTFKELGETANRLAGGLTKLGLRIGDRCIVFSKNNPKLVVIDHTLIWGGFVRVPLSFRLHPKEVAGIARDCGASVIFCDGYSQPGLREALNIIGIDTLVVVIDGSPELGAIPLEFIDTSLECEPASPLPEDLAWLPYTSGTTGEPKGVMLSHRSLLACARNLMVELPPFEETDVLLHLAPMSHLSGYVGMTASLRGVAQIPVPDFEPRMALDLIATHQASIIPMVPTMINKMLPEIETGLSDVSSVHTILYGGSAIAPDRLARAVKAFGNVFIQGYGLTEVPFPLASLSKKCHGLDDREHSNKLSSAGRVTPFIELRIVDVNEMDAPAGEPGEIWARGDVTMSGYWNRPTETADVIKDDAWVATGDVGRMKDGYLYIVDRKKDMIVSGGFNVFPSEIENVISTIHGVSEVAVIGIPSTDWGESIHAVIVRSPGSDLNEKTVVDACTAELAAFKKPRTINFVDSLPKTGSGKVLRREIRDQFWSERERSIGE